MQNSEIIIYENDSGLPGIKVRVEGETVWLTQAQLVELFDSSKANVSEHIKHIFEEDELQRDSVVRSFRTTAKDGKNYNVEHYNLDLIISLGYRVKSQIATKFRQWASNILKEYIVKGFAMDDERLKQVDRWDYFDEWLERIRDIRASEKRFYQKIRDIYTTAIDYDKKSEQAQIFFKKVQNKMLWATTGKTAAELIENRSNPDQPNMGLTSWRGSIVRKQDIAIAKNYLKADEVKDLNEIVTMYLDYAQRQARKRQTVSMAQWSEKLDAFLEFNEQEILTHAGKVKAEVAKKIAEERYTAFDRNRKQAEAQAADEEDIKQLEALAESLSTNRKKSND